MIVRQKSKVIPIEKSSTHYKMYKGGNLWLTAGITTLSMAGMMVVGMAVPAAAEEAKAGDVNGDGKIVVGYISIIVTI